MLKYVASAMVVAGILNSTLQAQPQPPNNVAESPNQAEVLKKAKELDDVAAKRHLRIQEDNKAFIDAMKTMPRGGVDLKTEKVVWESLVKLVPELMKENAELLALYPRYQADHKLLMTSLDEAIAGLQAAAQVCEKDAERQKTDAAREDFLALAQLARKAADSRKKDKTLAADQKGQVAKLMEQIAQDQSYFERLLQIVDLVRVPLEKQKEAEKFAQRLQRYLEQRELLRKGLRELTDKMDPSMPPAPPKVSSLDNSVPRHETVVAVSFKTEDSQSKKGNPGKDELTNNASTEEKIASKLLGGADAPANKALIFVHLPVDAELYLNGRLTVSKGSRRAFITPELEQAASYEYTARMQRLDDTGQWVTHTKTIAFRAGDRAHIFFDDALRNAHFVND